MLFKLYNSGILNSSDGKLKSSTKERILALLGYKDIDNHVGLAMLQEEKAQNENDRIRKGEVGIEEIDDDEIHVDEHVRYVLSEYDELSNEEKERLFIHIKAHKDRLAEKTETKSI